MNAAICLTGFPEPLSTKQEGIAVLPHIGGTSGVVLIRIILFWGPYWGLPV